jgi:hypothetical protein
LRNELGWRHGPWQLAALHRGHAERALRPTVIARKVSHCSKNDGGAHVLAAFASVVRNLAKNCIDSFVEGLYHLFSTPNAQPVSS